MKITKKNSKFSPYEIKIEIQNEEEDKVIRQISEGGINTSGRLLTQNVSWGCVSDLLSKLEKALE